MRVKVLGIAASPRRYGNSTKMLLVALHAAEEEGASTSILYLYDYRLNPCLACYSDNPYECYYPKKCPLYEGEDGYQTIAGKILESDAVIFATPVYWFNVAGHLKNLIDRMTSLENMVYHTGKSLVEGKVAGILAAGEEAGAALALSWLAFTLNMMGFHVPAWGTAYYHGRGDVLESAEAVNDAYNVGRNVVLAVKRLRGGDWYKRLRGEELQRLREEVAEKAREAREEARRWRTWL